MSATVDPTRLGYPVVDADNHYYEPYDCFTRHLEAAYADRSLHVVKQANGLGQLWFGDHRLGFMRIILSDYTGAPGTLRDLFEGTGTKGFVQNEVISAHDYPAMMSKAARLPLMDAQGVETALMFPSLGVAVEYEMQDDVEAFYANFRSFNRWIEEEWGYGADGRIFGAPMLSLLDLNLAVTELDRVLAAGARLVHLKPGPVGDRSPADPCFDPFWARVAEAGVLVAMHASDSGYNEQWSVRWGEPARPALQHMSPFQWYLGYGDRPIADTLAALVLNNLFGRFPTLRVLSIENGYAWLEQLLYSVDKAARMGRNGRPLGGHPAERPSDMLKQHVWVAPFPEEDPLPLVDMIGLEHVLFGSDYPHSEGLAEPVSYVEKLAGLSDADVRKVMRSNVAGLLGLSR